MKDIRRNADCPWPRSEMGGGGKMTTCHKLSRVKSTEVVSDTEAPGLVAHNDISPPSLRWPNKLELPTSVRIREEISSDNDQQSERDAKQSGSLVSGSHP